MALSKESHISVTLEAVGLWQGVGLFIRSQESVLCYSTHRWTSVAHIWLVVICDAVSNAGEGDRKRFLHNVQLSIVVIISAWLYHMGFLYSLYMFISHLLVTISSERSLDILYSSIQFLLYKVHWITFQFNYFSTGYFITHQKNRIH